MIAHSPRLPFSLAPLIAEAKRRMRRRRWLGAGLLVLAAATTAGLTFGLRPTGPENGRELVTARWDGVSVRYPSSWAHVDWCWTGLHFAPLALLTTAHPAPKCTKLGHSFSFPPAERLEMDGVSVTLAVQAIFPPGAKTPTWNARIGGQPANVSRPVYGRRSYGAVTCPTGVRREFRSVAVKSAAQGELFTVSAVICGPHLTASDAAVERLIASLSFKK